jgi:hypothetical protein
MNDDRPRYGGTLADHMRQASYADVEVRALLHAARTVGAEVHGDEIVFRTDLQVAQFKALTGVSVNGDRIRTPGGPSEPSPVPKNSKEVGHGRT